MGIVQRWRKGRQDRAIARANRQLDLYHTYAKDQFDSTPGGWEVLEGIVEKLGATWLDSNGIWASMSVQQMEEIYVYAAIIYACVNKIFTTAAEAPLKIGYQSRNGWKEVPNHPLMPVLRHPNKYMSENEFKQYMFMFLMLTGRSYVWEWRRSGGRGAISQLWPLPTSWVKVETGTGEEMITGYTVAQYGRNDIKIPPSDMTYLRFPDPTNLVLGTGPLQAALRDLQVDQRREDYLIEMLTNLKVPGLTLKSPKPIRDKQRKLLKERVAAALGLRRGGRGKEFILDAGMELELTNPLKDMDWPGVSSLSETRICSVFGVPPIIIGLRFGLQRSTYSNYEQALKAFYEGTMKPLWVHGADALTRGLLRAEGDTKHEIYFDLSEISQLQEDLDKVLDRAIKALQGSLITRNRAREMIGEEPLSEDLGEVILVKAGFTEQPINGQTEPEPNAGGGQGEETKPPNSKPETEERSEEEMEEAESKRLRNFWLLKGKNFTPGAVRRTAIAEGWAPLYRKRMERVIAKQFNEAIAVVSKGETFNAASMIDTWRKEYEEAKTPLIEVMSIDGWHLAGADFGKDASLIVTRSGFYAAKQSVYVRKEDQFVLQRMHEDIAGYIESTSKLESSKTAQIIDKAIRDAGKKELTPSGIAKQLVSKKVATTKSRATLLARTATQWSYNQGAMSLYKNEGVEQKEWVLTEDDDLCEFCEAMALQNPTQPIDGAWAGEGSIVIGTEGGALQVGEGIGDIEHPPLHPHCRCTIVPVV